MTGPSVEAIPLYRFEYFLADYESHVCHFDPTAVSCGVPSARILSLLPRHFDPLSLSFRFLRLVIASPFLRLVIASPFLRHFDPLSLSFRAKLEILSRRRRFLSRSPSHTFGACSFEMTRGAYALSHTCAEGLLWNDRGGISNRPFFVISGFLFHVISSTSFCHFERSEKSCLGVKISQSQSLTYVRGLLLRNDKGSPPLTFV
jgi:hypothetical protein